MSLYRQKGTLTWTMEFSIHGQRVRESTGTRSKTVAREVERKRRRELEEGALGIRKPKASTLLSAAADDYIKLKTPGWSADTLKFELSNLKHLRPAFDNKFIGAIEAMDISEYQTARAAAGASNRTINMEVGTLRAILKKSGHWARLLPDVKTLKTPKSKGKVYPKDVSEAVFAACKESRSRSLYPFMLLASATGSRYGTIKRLKWENVDFFERRIQWGEDKTISSSDRIIPLSQTALDCLLDWSRNFPKRKPEHFVFPFEKCGASGHRFGKAVIAFVPYDTDPTKPMGSLKTAWTNARINAHRALTGNPEEQRPVPFRTHDYRHTAFTQMRNKGVPLEKIAGILGWSPSQMVRMASIYGHFTLDDLREGVDAIGY